MHVIGHQHVGMYSATFAHADLAQLIQVADTIDVLKEAGAGGHCPAARCAEAHRPSRVSVGGASGDLTRKGPIELAARPNERLSVPASLVRRKVHTEPCFSFLLFLCRKVHTDPCFRPIDQADGESAVAGERYDDYAASGLASSDEWMSGDTTLLFEPALLACQISGLRLK